MVRTRSGAGARRSQSGPRHSSRAGSSGACSSRGAGGRRPRRAASASPAPATAQQLVHVCPIPDPSAGAHGALRAQRLPRLYTASILLLTLAGKAGDVLAPTLLTPHPLLLLALNANDLHLALTSAHSQLLAWVCTHSLPHPLGTAGLSVAEDGVRARLVGRRWWE